MKLPNATSRVLSEDAGAGRAALCDGWAIPDDAPMGAIGIRHVRVVGRGCRRCVGRGDRLNVGRRVMHTFDSRGRNSACIPTRVEDVEAGIGLGVKLEQYEIARR